MFSFFFFNQNIIYVDELDKQSLSYPMGRFYLLFMINSGKSFVF